MKNIAFILLFFLSAAGYPTNFDSSNLTNKDGLSNSSVTVIFQDSNQLMWFGTWDGLNMYNGREFKVYKPTLGNAQSISNHIIRDIIEEKQGVLWIATDLGINRLNINTQTFEHFFVDSQNREAANEHSYLIAKNPSGQIIASVYQQGLYYFNAADKQFIPLKTDKALNIKKIIFNSNDGFWILTKDNTLYHAVIQIKQGHPVITDMHCFETASNIENIYGIWPDKLLLQTTDETIYEYSKRTNSLIRLPLKEKIGHINSVAIKNGLTYLGSNNGLFRYSSQTGVEHVISDSPVLSVCQGSQNIIWAGTDMKGVWKIVPLNEHFKTYSAENVKQFGNAAVRTFFEDDAQILWVGTKGNGIYGFRKDPETGTLKYNQRLDTSDGLLSNSVYKIIGGSAVEFWIGTEGNGINYYDKKTKLIHSLTLPEGLKFSSVYTILPQNNTLWIGTSGDGMYKLTINRAATPYEVVGYRHFVFSGQQPSLSNNIVYSIIEDDENHLWIGTRGGGVNRFDINAETFQVYRFSGNNPGNFSSNDVLCLYKDNNGNLWAGTSMGLNKLERNAENNVTISNFGEKDGIPNNTIHGILEDGNNAIWISTNNGIAKLVPHENTYRIISYFANDGLQDNEFSDGAYYASPHSSILYFGGINGFNSFNPLEVPQNEFMPTLWLDAFYVDNVASNLSEYLTLKNGVNTLSLSHKNKSFSFRFVPIDFIASSKCEISYKLEGFHNEWVNLGTSNTVVFTNLPKGNYVLKIKSSNANKIWGETLFTLPVKMAPPWWNSNPAYLIYALVFFILAAIIKKAASYRIRVRNQLKMKELERQKTEEIHQEKLRFFTNIAHEFSNSLTLIYGPCDKLIKQKDTVDTTKKYLQVIKSNSERMQNLIEELVEFRKVETGHLKLKPETVDIPELVKYVIDNFIEVLEQKKIEYSTTFIPEKIHWRTDRNSLEKIIFNLLSNAVKYTPQEEHIDIQIEAEDDTLSVSVRNTGIGINPENIKNLFNRFEVLNQLEEQASLGNYPRHGIGLALSKSIANALKGNIQAQSDGKTFTQFLVCLPAIPEEVPTQEVQAMQPPFPDTSEKLSSHEDHTSKKKDKVPNEPFILVVEDDPEIRSMIKDLLKTEYPIFEASNGKEALSIVSEQYPILIISDIIMPEMNGFEFVKIMKTQESTSHIPIILLSSKSSIENQIEGFETGADAYIGKPFNLHHLEILIKNLLKRKSILKEYSNSPYSALEQYDGKLIQREDKTLLINITKIIQDNIENEELSLDFIASETAVSKMQLYRKIKEITENTPTEFIRSIRLQHASKLLKTTGKTVQEIMYSSGFNNKAYFYREFSKKYNKTPREYRETGD